MCAANDSELKASVRERFTRTAEVFGDYHDLGISHFLIRGFDPLIDAIEYGRELIPLTRKLIAERQATKGVAAE